MPGNSELAKGPPAGAEPSETSSQLTKTGEVGKRQLSAIVRVLAREAVREALKDFVIAPA